MDSLFNVTKDDPLADPLGPPVPTPLANPLAKIPTSSDDLLQHTLI